MTWLLVPLSLLSGCPAPCTGAQCGDVYPAGALRVYNGATLPVGDVAPLDSAAAIAGTAAEGNRWSLAAGTGSLFVGVPDAGAVWWYNPTALAEAGGPAGRLTWGTAGDDFGAGVSTWAQPDGTVRLLVGAPLASSGPALDGAGALLVYDGGAGFTGAVDGGLPLQRVNGSAPEVRFGSAVVVCGDIDNDGASDWVAWAPWGSSGGDLGGEVSVFRSGVDSREQEIAADSLLTLAGGEAEGFGTAMWCAASLDSDEVADLVVGVPGGDSDAGVAGTAVGGNVVIYHGGPNVGEGEAALVLRGREVGEGFGSALAVGDLDGDGAPDLVVGAPGRTGDGVAEGVDNRAGAAYIFLGRRLRSFLEAGIFLGTYEPDHEIHGVYERESLGNTLAVADLDGDGRDELLVGAPGLNPTGAAGAVQSGAIYVYRFGDWPPVQDTADAATTITQPRQYLRTGERFAVGDVDRDGGADVVVLNHVEAE